MRGVNSRGEKSIIDYLIVENNNRNMETYTKVRRGPEIGSDHYLVITKIKKQRE